MRRGFTLIELVITLGIFTIMMTLLITFYVSSNSTFVYDKSYIDVTVGAASIQNDMTRYGRQADRIIASHAFTTGTLTTGSGVLVLEVPAVSSSGTTLGGKYDYVGYYTTGSTAYRVIDADAASTRSSGQTILSRMINVLTFSYDASDPTQAKSVTIDTTAQATAKGATLTHHLTKQIYLRNTSL